MSTRLDSVLPPLILDRRAPRTQTRETPVAVPARERMTRIRTSSWDPYEVWRTRVKSPTTPDETPE
ncbi:MAG: hypothetical protein WAM52_14905 [Steroidobacteraceae bacterium]